MEYEVSEYETVKRFILSREKMPIRINCEKSRVVIKKTTKQIPLPILQIYNLKKSLN
jgi:hypothetical protein